jgi:hypothetical protein
MDALRRILAVLIALRGLTNFAKPFRGGFVIFYAFGLWHARPWARPLGIAYAVWATLNVVLFYLVEGVPPQFAPWMYAVFAAAGIAAPWLAVWLLGQRRT